MHPKLTLLLITCILFFLVIPARAEVYQLLDGSVQVGERIYSPKSPTIRLESLIGMVEFPSDVVKSVENKSSILRTYKKLRSRLDPEQIRCFTTLAKWCRDKGLYTEMFKLYDHVGTTDPDNREFKAFVYEMANSIQYQEIDGTCPLDEKEGYALLVKTSKSKLTLNRIGEEILLSMPSEIVGPVLLKGLNHSYPPIKIESIRIMALLTPEDAIEPLIATAIFDKKEKVRKTAVDTLKSYQHDGIIYPFLRALKTNNRSYRMNALAALSAFNDMRATGALIANLARASSSSPGSHRAHIYSGSQTSAVTGFDTEVAQSAVIADPIVNIIQDGALLDVNVLGISPGRAILREERKMLADVLKSITGMNYGEDYLMWKQWWTNNRQKIIIK